MPRGDGRDVLAWLRAATANDPRAAAVVELLARPEPRAYEIPTRADNPRAAAVVRILGRNGGAHA